MSPNPNYIKGIKKERVIVNKARKDGHLAFRSAGSHSPVDVIIVDNVQDIVRLIQCKPDSMTDKAKQKLYDKHSHLDGVYFVKFEVI